MGPKPESQFGPDIVQTSSLYCMSTRCIVLPVKWGRSILLMMPEKAHDTKKHDYNAVLVELANDPLSNAEKEKKTAV